MTTSHQTEPANEKAQRPKDENEHPDDEIQDEHAAGESVSPPKGVSRPGVVPIPRDDAERNLPPDPDPDDPVSP